MSTTDKNKQDIIVTKTTIYDFNEDEYVFLDDDYHQNDYYDNYSMVGGNDVYIDYDIEQKAMEDLYQMLIFQAALSLLIDNC